ncbi:MAG: hypothetical protein WBM77_13345 [Maribacter sp.]
MKKNFIIYVLLLIGSYSYAQIDGTLLLGLTHATTSEMSSIANPVEGSLIYNKTEKTIYQYNGSGWTLAINLPADIADGDDNTQLSKTDIEALGFVEGGHSIDTNTQLTEAEVDAFTANNGYITSATVVSDDSNNSITAGSDGGAFLEQNLTTTTIQVDQSSIWAGQVNDTDIHSNGTLTVQQTRTDTGWSFSGPSTITYSGSPDYVEIDLMAVANNTGNHWAHPHIKIFRNGQQIGEGSGLHMDDSGSYSGRTTTVISMVDPTPGNNPIYTFTTLEDDNRTMNNATITSLSPVSLVAMNKIDVVISVSN